MANNDPNTAFIKTFAAAKTARASESNSSAPAIIPSYDHHPFPCVRTVQMTSRPPWPHMACPS